MFSDRKPTASSRTIFNLIVQRAEEAPDKPFICSPGWPALTYGALALRVRGFRRTLCQLGITASDTVATCFRSGLDAASGFLSVAAACRCAPINPDLAKEAEFYLRDSHAKALVVGAGESGAVLRAAHQLGIRVLEYAGVETEMVRPLAGGTDEKPRDVEDANTSDVALLLHTSGTTGPPKRVGLTHGNLLTSAQNIAGCYRLDAGDRCLNVMPLFHIHGIVAGILAPLVAGGSIVCPDRFSDKDFCDWLVAFSPTWYTAVPTMHQAVLKAIETRGSEPLLHSLRFARSCSAAINPGLISRLEQHLGVPMLEAYGMTEASHQISSAQLPPQTRKPGSVGISTGVEIAIRDDFGVIHDHSASGEVLIRGPTVISEYLDNPDANARAFLDGWFRTGDVGRLDDLGVLELIGRDKEMINRGGEKIAPFEIDRALSGCPEIAQGVAFAMLHPTLGEEVAAAVILRPGCRATEAAIRQALRGTLAEHKIPRKITIVTDLPKGPTGKIQRVELTRMYGSNPVGTVGQESPGSTGKAAGGIEIALLGLWAETLGHSNFRVEDDFFAIGGDSLQAMQLVADVNETFALNIQIELIFSEASTVADMAAYVRRCRALPDGSIPRDGRHVGPASFAQQSSWAIAKMFPGAPVQNVGSVLEITGALEKSVLADTLTTLAEKHAVLRTTLAVEDGQLVQVVRPAGRVTWSESAITGSDSTDRSRKARHAARRSIQEQYDLRAGPMFRPQLVSVDEQKWFLVLGYHHAIADGISRSIILDDLLATYQAYAYGERASLRPKSDYLEFAARQLEDLENGDYAPGLEFWRESLRGATYLSLAADHGGGDDRFWRADYVSVDLADDVAGRTRDFARSRRTTFFAVLLTALELVLLQETGQTDILVGVPVANRPGSRFEGAVGCYANVLPVRAELQRATLFCDALNQIRTSLARALSHQMIPVELIGRELRRTGCDGTLTPPVQFQFRRFENSKALKMDAFEMKSRQVPTGIAATELSVDATESHNGVKVVFTFRKALLERSRVERIAHNFVDTLAAGIC